MNNLEQIKGLIKLKLESVAIKLMIKDIHEILDETPPKPMRTRRGNIKLVIDKKSHHVLDVVSTGIVTRITQPKTHKHSKGVKHISTHQFHKFEDLNPLQVWLLAYVYIPKLTEKEEDHEGI